MSLDYQQAVYRLESCEAMKDKGRDQLLRGENGEPAVPGINPNRITPKYLEPYIVELRRVTRQLEEIVEEHGVPGDNLLGEFYWAGVDDLKRLRTRANYYQAAVNHAKGLGPTQQRVFLYEHVFLPVFYGSRHKNVTEPTSPWVHTLSDYCEPARIYKNYVYAVDVNDAHTGLGPFLNALGEATVDFFRSVGEVTDKIYRSGKKVVEVAGKAAKGIVRAAMPIGILLAGIGIYILARKQKGGGGA